MPKKTTAELPKQPGEPTDLMKANFNLMTGQNQLVLLSGFYNNQPAVHLAAVIKDGEDFLIFPIARMYTERDMKLIGDPENKRTENVDKEQN